MMTIDEALEIAARIERIDSVNECETHTACRVLRSALIKLNKELAHGSAVSEQEFLHHARSGMFHR